MITGRKTVALPTRLLDLTPMDFFLWGHIYALPVDSEEYLIAHIVETVATIRQQPDTLESRQSQLCIEATMFGHYTKFV